MHNFESIVKCLKQKMYIGHCYYAISDQIKIY